MPHIPGRVPNPAFRTGLAGARPLAVRFEEAREIAWREIPADDPARQAANLYESEHNYDRLLTAIEEARRRKAAAQPQPDRWVQAKLKVLREERASYHVNWQELRERQHQAQRLSSDWQHQLLGTLNDPVVFTVPGMIDPTADTPGLTTEADIDAAILEIRQQHEALKARLERLKTAMFFEAQGREHKNYDLIQALWVRMQQLETELRGKSKKRTAT